MTDQTALTVRESYGLMNIDQVAETIRVNLGGGGISLFDLDTIHVPNSGAAFEFPTLDEMDTVKSFTGIIVAMRDMRRYYADAYQSGVKTPPTCSSTDMAYGEGDPGGSCRTCPFNQYGTARGMGDGPGKGKACSEYRYLFTCIPNRVLPIVVAVPPTSLTAVRKYMMRLTDRNRTYFSVETTFSLLRGDPVPTISFTMGNVIPADELQGLEQYFAEMRHTFASVTLDPPVED